MARLQFPGLTPLLQQACGFEYTSKLQKMFQDTHTSKDLNDRFQEHCVSSTVGKMSRKFYILQGFSL